MDFNEFLDRDSDDDQDDNSFHRANIARMREEKERQVRQRAMLKKMVPVAMAGVLAVILVITGLVLGIKKISNGIKEKRAEAALQAQLDEAQEEIAIPTPEIEPEKPKPVYYGMVEVKVPLPEMVEGYSMDVSGANKAITEEDVQSQFVTLVNASTGKVLVSRNALDRMNPASMTKVMTVLVACENISDLNQACEIMIEDTDFAYLNDLSIAGFEEGEIVPLKDILYGAIMPSGGECCHALERIVAGDEETFIKMMNDKAKELGLKNTHYTNSAGLYNDNHYTTPVDMAMVMKAAIENELCRQILYEHIYTTASTEQHIGGLELSNWFQRRIEDKYKTTEVMGAKTGYVIQSGNCAVSYTIDENGEVYICVTGNAHSAWRAIFDHVALYDMYITDKKSQ